MAVTLPAGSFETELEPGSSKALLKIEGVRESRGSANLMMVPPDQITVLDGFNVRIAGTAAYKAGIEALAASIESEGFYHDKPLTGFVSKMEDGTTGVTVVDGHRRLEAIRLLQETEGRTAPEAVPVLLKQAGTSMIDLTVALDKTGEGLSPLERATVCKRLQGLGVEDGEIVRRLGITPRYLQDLLLLLGAPRKLLGMVAEGKMSATLAVQELRAGGKPSEVVARVTAAADTAAAKGKDKVTRKDLAPAEPPAAPAPGRYVTTKTVFKAKRGDSVPLDAIAAFSGYDGGSWWDHTEDPTEADVTEDITITLVVKRRAGAFESADEQNITFDETEGL